MRYFFKQKTAYEIPKRDWSSDVCSSDLARHLKKSFEHFQPAGVSQIYQFIEQAAETFPVQTVCQVLGVSKSGYYASRRKAVQPLQRELAEAVEAAFWRH